MTVWNFADKKSTVWNFVEKKNNNLKFYPGKKWQSEILFEILSKKRYNSLKFCRKKDGSLKFCKEKDNRMKFSREKKWQSENLRWPFLAIVPFHTIPTTSSII